MHDLLFENQNRFEEALFLTLGARLGLNSESLRQALKEGRFTEKIRRDFSGGVKSGVNGTPTFFINGRSFFAIAFKITSCSFIIRSASRAVIAWLVSTPPA
jgi:protein-disulfide isomerase